MSTASFRQLDTMKKMEKFTTLTLKIQGHIAIIALNDVQRRNALSRHMVSDLFDALESSREIGARAVVIAANGATFCAGANIEDLRDGWMEQADPKTDPAFLFQRIAEEDRIIVAAVQGPALGGGFELTMACDLVIAEEPAWFALPEVTRGVIPNTGLVLLQHIVGTRQALNLVLSAKRISADEALQMGLVNEVVDTGAAIERAVEFATTIVTNAPPAALSTAKHQLHRHARYDWQRVQNCLAEVPNEEWQEGLNAFIEKRAPDFTSFWAARMGIQTNKES